MYEGKEHISCSISPLSQDDKCDMKHLVIPPSVKSVAISRYLHVRRIMPIKDDAGLLNGLHIPGTVTSLMLTDRIKGKRTSSPVCSIAPNLERFEAVCLQCDDVIHVCMYSPNLTKLSLTDVKRLYMMDVIVGVNLTYLEANTCRIWRLPSNMDVLFPNLTTLKICNTKIDTIRGVTFPPRLDYLVISGSACLSVVGAVFPDSITCLELSNHKSLVGIDTVKLPRDLETLEMECNNLEWISTKWELPAGLKYVHLERNPKIDLRVFRNYRKKHRDFFIDVGRNPRCVDHLEATYNHQDAIARFLNNGVMCVDLLRHVRGFLE